MPTVRLKVDEDLPTNLVRLLRDRGHDATSVVEQGWTGTPDKDLFPKIKAEGRLFLTADKEFGDIRKFPPGSHPGILLFRTKKESMVVYRSILLRVLSETTFDQLRGCITIATERLIRIRRTP
jgi:predicted nuclease of predicted toxin-antitoxin system